MGTFFSAAGNIMNIFPLLLINFQTVTCMSVTEMQTTLISLFSLSFKDTLLYNEDWNNAIGPSVEGLSFSSAALAQQQRRH